MARLSDLQKFLVSKNPNKIQESKLLKAWKLS